MIQASASNKPDSRHWSFGQKVLEEHRFRADMPTALRPCFGDDEWDLAGTVGRANAAHGDSVGDFTKFSDPIARLTAKELMFQKLNRPKTGLYRNPAPMASTSLKSAVNDLHRFYRFMEDCGVPNLISLTQQHLNAYVAHLKTSGANAASIARYIRVIFWLHEHRDGLSLDHIPFAPWPGKSSFNVAGAKASEENKTQRVPESTMGPLMQWALFYIEKRSTDIISASSLHRNEADEAPRRFGRCSLEDSRTRLQSWLDDCRSTNLPLPGHALGANRVSFDRISKLAEISLDAAYKLRDVIEEAIPLLGICTAPARRAGSRHSEKPQLIRHPTAPRDIADECKYLITACYVVCSYLSGMRDSEVQEIRRGAYQPTRDDDGNIVRHKITSYQFKGQKNPRGKKRSWVIIEPVAKAIEALEELARTLRSPNDKNLLFVLINPKSENPALKRMINEHIKHFIAHVNLIQPHSPELNLPLIPMGTADEPVRITTRMFRRTVAWHIANRPFGVVAGMIQFGHAAEITFEGYAGHSESGFRAEVEAEQEIARRGDIVEMYEDHKRGVKAAGPMSAELAVEFDNVRDAIGDFPGKIVDERRLHKMLEHLRIRLHPGLLADCFFDPADAVCLKHVAEKDRKVPVVGICDPHCSNACWLKKHLSVWKNELGNVQKLGARNRISPIQRGILRDKAKEYKAVIQAINEASGVS